MDIFNMTLTLVYMQIWMILLHRELSVPVLEAFQPPTRHVSIRPHSSALSGDSSTQRPTLPSWPSIWSFTWQGLETSSWSTSRALDRPTPQRH